APMSRLRATEGRTTRLRASALELLTHLVQRHKVHADGGRQRADASKGESKNRQDIRLYRCGWHSALSGMPSRAEELSPAPAGRQRRLDMGRRREVRSLPAAGAYTLPRWNSICHRG